MVLDSGRQVPGEGFSLKVAVLEESRSGEERLNGSS
jgi:hypothetical protein